MRVHAFTGPLAYPGFRLYDREAFEDHHAADDGAQLAAEWGRLTPPVAMFITPGTGRGAPAPETRPG